MAFVHPEFLISHEALLAKLGNENLRIFDVAVHIEARPKGGYEVESGRRSYDEAHIPGAAFLDQLEQLSDSASTLAFTRLQDDLLIRAFAKAGINADSDVVFYSSNHAMWATRAWWLLHYCGHRRSAVLDGGLQAWRNAGLNCVFESSAYAEEIWTSETRPRCFVDQDAVIAAIDDAGVCTFNALSPDVYAGKGDHHYGRRGHIPNSINVFYDTLLQEGCFRSPDMIRQLLADAGLLDDRNVIAYCGGGISATMGAFACLLLGKDNIAVYDGSMSEWVKDESLPLIEGSNP
jgi:thiosulfate/3-mercaptopyruvate sulfurtransferase